MNEPIELSWTPGVRDWTQASWVVTGARLTVIAVLAACVGVLGLALHEVIFGVLLVALFPALALVQWVTVALFFRRNRGATAVHHALVGDRGVQISQDGVTMEYAWAMIAEWREASRTFILRTGGARALSALLLPKRGLTADGCRAVRQTLTERVGPVRNRRTVQLNAPAPHLVTAAPQAGPPTGPPTGAAGGDRIELRWTPQRADWAEAIRAFSWLSRLFPWLGLAIVLSGVAWSVARFHASSGVYSFNLLDPVFVLALFLGIFVGCLTSVQARGILRRNPVSAGERQVTLEETGMHVTVAGVRTSATWASYAGFRERRRAFVLRHRRSSLVPVTLLAHRGVLAHVTLVAKRGVLAPTDVDYLRAILERQLATGGTSGPG